jgi:hypothetical protein
MYCRWGAAMLRVYQVELDSVVLVLRQGRFNRVIHSCSLPLQSSPTSPCSRRSACTTQCHVDKLQLLEHFKSQTNQRYLIDLAHYTFRLPVCDCVRFVYLSVTSSYLRGVKSKHGPLFLRPTSVPRPSRHTRHPSALLPIECALPSGSSQVWSIASS